MTMSLPKLASLGIGAACKGLSLEGSGRVFAAGWNCVALGSTSRSYHHDAHSAGARFASASSSAADPRSAAASVAASVHEQLGASRPPSLCLLLAKCQGSWGVEVGNIAQWVRECLRTDYGTKPTVIGCVLQSVGGSMSGGGGGGVGSPELSLWAAHLPGTEVYPFLASSDNLPELSDGAWPKLVGAAAGSDAQPGGTDAHGAKPPPPSTAALLFCPPHFVDAEPLAQRLASVLPAGSPVLGAIGAPGAWGRAEAGAPAWGAAYLDDSIYVRDSAVGAILHGQFEVRAATLPAHTGVGPSMTVTGAMGGLVTHLDGRCAGDAIADAMQHARRELSTRHERGGGSSDGGAELKLGVSSPECARGDVALRSWTFVDGPGHGHASVGRPTALMVAAPMGVPVGATVQLHCQSTLSDGSDIIRQLSASMASLGAPSGLGSTGALLLPSSRLPLIDLSQAQQALPGCAVASGCVEGELGSVEPVSVPPRLHDLSTNMILFGARAQAN